MCCLIKQKNIVRTAVVLVAIGSLATACGSSTQPIPASKVSLTKKITFNGLSIRVPSFIQVYNELPSAVCPLNNTMFVGPQSNIPCPHEEPPIPGSLNIEMSTERMVSLTSSGNIMFYPERINNISIEVSASEVDPSSPPINQDFGFAMWYVEIPSYNVSLVFTENLYRGQTHGAMALARRIMGTLSVSGPTPSATH